VLPKEPAEPDQAFTEAVRAWRRAVRSTDPIEVAGALDEATQFYAARATMPEIFSYKEKAIHPNRHQGRAADRRATAAPDHSPGPRL